MGKNKRSSKKVNERNRQTVERLPKEERREAAGKLFTLRSPSSTSSVSTMSSLTLRAHEDSSPSDIPLALTLPIESLQHIFRAAGHLATVTATRVAPTWRVAALDLLTKTKHVDVGKLFFHTPVLTLTYPHVRATLSSFPSITSLTLARWRPDALPDIASSLMHDISTPTLSEIDLSTHQFDPAHLVTLLAHNPLLATLHLASCTCVTDATITRLISTRQPAVAARSSPPIDRLDISACPAVTHASISRLASSGIVRDLVASKSAIANHLRLDTSHLRSLNLSSSPRLRRVSVGVAAASLTALNLSQCPLLEDISLYNTLSGATALQLVDINLSGAAHLVDIDFGVEENTADDDGTPLSPLPFVETVSLFGARTLAPAFFARTLGLGNEVALMPRLSILNLNGCRRIDRICLRGYLHLREVDCCGCQALECVVIGNVPKLTVFKIRGKSAPLRLVDITAPPEAVFDGVRQAWNFVRTAGGIRITYNYVPPFVV